LGAGDWENRATGVATSNPSGSRDRDNLIAPPKKRRKLGAALPRSASED
jgi:hypothetical protein